MMEGHFVPECYFDTVLVRIVLRTKEVLNHKKGCNNVVKVMKEGELKDSFAVGIVDKDKKELNYLCEFNCYEFETLKLYKHKSKPHYIIQLDPPLEKWILVVDKEAGIDITKFGLPSDIERLKKFTKSELAGETQELKSLCKALFNSNSVTIKRFARWIIYLHENKYVADINDIIHG